MWYVERGGEEVKVEARREGEGLRVRVGDWEERVHVIPLGRGVYQVEMGNRRLVVYRGGDRLEVLAPFRAWVQPVELASLPRAFRRARKGPHRQRMQAPMSGRVVEVHVVPGQEVEEGALLMVMEAMKMRNEIRAPFSGTVVRVDVAEGEVVDRGKVLLEIEAPSGDAG